MLSVSIIGHNEEHCLDRCLNSIKDADEIIYVDCESSDKSIEVAKRYTTKIYERENNPNINVNKSFGFTKATKEWLLYIDPDEFVSEELFEEIKKVINSNSKFDGYYIPRRNYYFGKWLKRGGKYPDNQLRLFKRDKGEFHCIHVHEKMKINGNAGYLKNPILHYPYETISQYIKKFDFYTSFEANFLYSNSVNINFFNTYKWIIHKPIIRFMKRYILKLGFLDSFPGLFAALGDCAVYIVTYIKLWDIYRSEEIK